MKRVWYHWRDLRFIWHPRQRQIGGDMDQDSACDPAYARMDELLEVLTRSKALHVMLVLDQHVRPVRFTDLKRHVDGTSTTVSRRLKELHAYGLIEQVDGEDGSGFYALTEKAKTLSPIFHNLFNWVAAQPS